MDHPATPEVIAEHLEALRKRLIDISNRNKLVNFRPTKKACIELAFPNISELHTNLVEGEEELRLQLGVEYLVDGARSKRKKPGVVAEPLYVARVDADNALQRKEVLCRHDESDLEARSDYVRREAKAVLDETGINHLYLALGFLRWRESEDSEEERRAPLLLIPILISRNTVAGRGGVRYFTIAHDGGELFPNLSLVERLRTDFGLDLPKFGEESSDAEEYLADIARTVRGRRGWGVDDTAFISFFSFAKMRMYLDLDPANWPEGRGLLENTLVQQILEGSLSEVEESGYGGVEVTDDHPVAHEIPLVVEADSSQHTSILKVWQNRNLVIEGPPGTGKSQTITNMIAAALHQGKSVLFVSEKLAALEVVKRNLDIVGLGEFCLELHSHKTRKREVHASLDRRVRWRPPTAQRWEATCREWRRQVAQLKQYLDACGRCLGPREEEVFRILGRAIHLRECDIPTVRDPLSRLDINAERFEEALVCLQEIGRHLQNPADFRDHPWKGFLCENIRAGDELAIAPEFGKLIEALESAALVARQFEQIAGPNSCPPLHFIEKFSNSSHCALPGLPEKLACDILAALAKPDGSAALAATIECAREHREHLRAASETLSPGAIGRGGLGVWLGQASEIATTQRLGGVTIAALQEKLPSLAEIAALCVQATELAESIARLDLGSAATVHDLERFLGRLRVCGSAPAQIDKLLSGEHRFPHAEKVLADARGVAAQLSAQKQVLEATFACADTPDSATVQELKKRLRTTGGSWLSIFSREYRQTRGAVLGFLRSRKLFAFPGILEALDALEQWCKRTEDFSAAPELKSVLGTAFRGLDTDWETLSSVVRWALAMARESLPWTVVEQIAQPETQKKVRELAAHLDTTLRRLERAAADAMFVLDALFHGRPYQTLDLRDFSRATSEWSEWLRQTLDAVFPVAIHKTSTFEQLKAAATRVLAAERLATSIESDEIFREVAGDHAKGLETDWETLAITREWVEQVRAFGLPPLLFSWSLTPEVKERSAMVNEVLARLTGATSQCETIIRRLETYGTVERDWLWGPDGNACAGRIERARSIQAKAHLLQQWALFRKLYVRADEFEARFAVDHVLNGSLAPEQAHEAFDLAVNEFYGYEVLRTFRELETFTHDSHQHLTESFRKTDRDLLEQAQAEVAQRAANRRPPSGSGVGPVKSWTEWALLRNEINKQTRHIPLRQLMRRAGRAVVAWKPCLMMSPLSVAQFLDPRCMPFDLVVMDEASQIRPEDALGAVARAKQMVVVGDTKQMPPSNYWSRTLNDDEDDDGEDDESSGRGVAQDAESILECAKNAFPPAQRLLWHYRSQHESLIRFSNYAYYDEELIVFPAASDDSGRLGIRFRHLPEGRYKTGARVNEVEAACVARAALAHLVENDETLMVATFNKPQQELIEELVEKYAAEDTATFERLEQARQHMKEPFAVKNLENVQGDERDVVFISCTYGPDQNTGVVHQRFGPLAGLGGRRRLNVLFTRAKRRVELFSSITHDQIVGNPGEPNGVNDFRDYLRFAQSGILADAGQMTHQSPDSFFEEAVMRVVNSTGLRAVPQVGVSRYRVDIGVEHPSRPGEFLLGIECDGAMYHSSKSARDRDRLRQEVLERRGWKIYRIWSTDWFRQNQAAKQRLLAVLRELT